MAMFVRAPIMAFPEHHAAVAADRRVRRHRLDGARLVRGDRPAQHQAADGLFLDRPHGLRAGRARGRHAGRRAGRAGLHGDLSRDDARHLRLHPRRCGAAAGMVEQIADLAGPRAHQSGDGVLPRRAAVLARRHSAARRLLREVLRVPRRHQGRALRARRASACSRAWSAPTTICASSRSCISTSRRRRSTPMPRELKLVLGDHRRCSRYCSSSIRRRWSTAATPRRKSLF